MMSSEEDYDVNLLQDSNVVSGLAAGATAASSKSASFGGGGTKTKPGKRVRQRVDAGEPRNSYAAIPNFTSRPTTNGYIVSSAGSKLISDLLARQRASSSSSNVSETNSMTVEMEGSTRNGTRPPRNVPSASSAATAHARSGPNASQLSDGKSPLFLNGNDDSTSDLILNQEELVENSYLLRSILQERKNFTTDGRGGRNSPGSSVTESEDADDDEMMVSQEDSDNGGAGRAGGSASSPRPRRGRHREVYGNMLEEAFLAAAVAAATSSSSAAGHGSENVASTRCGNAPTLPILSSSASVGALQALPAGPCEKEDRDEEEEEEEEEKRNEGPGDKMSSVSRSQERFRRRRDGAADSLDSGSAASSRSASPKSARGNGASNQENNNNSSLQELKRARVETIVSNMLHVPGALSSGRSPSTNGSSYPEPNVPVNGCKKRKLYQPQQHEAPKAAEGNGDQYFNDEEEDSELAADDPEDDEPTEPEDRIEPGTFPPRDGDDDFQSPRRNEKKKRSDRTTNVFKSQLSQVQKQVAVMEQKYRQLCESSRVESSPARSEELNSVEDQIKRDCDSDSVRQKSSASPSGQFRPGRESNCLNLPNVYYVSTPKDRRETGFRENGPSDEASAKNSGRKSEDRQSCIVKTSSASSSSPNSSNQIGCPDLEWLVDSLKSELSSTLSTVIETIVSKYAQRRSNALKASRKELLTEPPRHQSHSNHAEPPPQPPMMGPMELHQQPPTSHKEFNILSQMLDRKSPRTKVIDRGNRANGQSMSSVQRTSPYLPDNKGPLYYPRNLKRAMNPLFCVSPNASLPTGPRECHSPPTPPNSLLTAAALGLAVHPHHNHPQLHHQSQIPAPPPPPPASLPTSSSGDLPEQTEAMSLVVAPKKKRQKVTDTRITPRTVSRLLVQEPELPVSKYQQLLGNLGSIVNFQEQVAAFHHAATGGHPGLPPPPLVPVSLPTSVAIPNPSLHQSDVFNPFHFENAHRFGHFNNNNNNNGHNSFMGSSLDHNSLEEDSLVHGGSPSLHSSLLGGPHGSPDSMNHYSGLGGSFKQENGDGSDAGDSQTYDSGMAMMHTSTLTPMHLRKAKLMFFYVRYPSSAILKMYFPDIKFNKNNTAQLVKWFSNFREFYYIQMEKYARQAISDGVKNSEEIKVSIDAELIRVLNLHYNRNNHIEVPENFRYVVEQTLREFFKALFAGKDAEQSWKKAIYKIIARLDDGVPEYFKTPNFLEQLE